MLNSLSSSSDVKIKILIVVLEQYILICQPKKFKIREITILCGGTSCPPPPGYWISLGHSLYGG